MKVYIVFYYNDYREEWIVGDVYYNYAEADEEAKAYDGYVLTREVK